jgi:hypothetical protein
MPHLPKDFAGRPESLVMIRDRRDGLREVLRLWASGATLEGADQPVWLGQVRVEAIDDILGLFNRWRDTGEGKAAMQALEQSLEDADSRVVGERQLRLIRQSSSSSSAS